MTFYYAQAFKTGIYPPIMSDRLYIWSRPHAASVIARNQSIPKPHGWEWVSISLLELFA